MLRSYPTVRPDLQGCGAVRCGESAPLFMQATNLPGHSTPPCGQETSTLRAVWRGGNDLVFIPKGIGWPKKRHKSEIGCSGGSKSVGGSLWDLSISKDRCTGFSGQRRPPHGILGPFLGGVFRVHLRTAFPGCISRVATDLELTAERRAMCGSPFQRVSFST